METIQTNARKFRSKKYLKIFYEWYLEEEGEDELVNGISKRILFYL